MSMTTANTMENHRTPILWLITQAVTINRLPTKERPGRIKRCSGFSSFSLRIHWMNIGRYIRYSEMMGSSVGSNTNQPVQVPARLDR